MATSAAPADCPHDWQPVPMEASRYQCAACHVYGRRVAGKGIVAWPDGKLRPVPEWGVSIRDQASDPEDNWRNNGRGHAVWLGEQFIELATERDRPVMFGERDRA